MPEGLFKLIIQVPCLNEVPRLAGVLASLPRELHGIDKVELLVIDDGSTDGTADAALAAGVDHRVRFPHNRGLSVAFQEGLRAALQAGADIVVNTDADNQCEPSCIPDLFTLILAGAAAIVINDCDPHEDLRSCGPNGARSATDVAH